VQDSGRKGCVPRFGQIHKVRRKETMSSLTSPGLIKATNDALIKIVPELNVLKLFSWDFSDQVSDWGSVVKVPIVNGGTAGEFNIESNDYENTTGAVTYQQV